MALQCLVLILYNSLVIVIEKELNVDGGGCGGVNVCKI